jgi:phosphate starvation-inducible PhoH-like protein
MVDKQPKGAFYMSSKTTRRKLTLESNSSITILFKEDPENEVFKLIEAKYDIELKINAVGILVARGDKDKTLDLESRIKRSKKPIQTIEDLKTLLDDEIFDEQSEELSSMLLEFKDKSGKSTTIVPKNQHQKDLIDAIIEKKIVFGNGASGTGKTMLAVCVALKMLEKGMVKKIWITRPNLPAENFGFLPGDIDSKMLPFFMPVYNIIDGLVGKDRREDYIEKGKIEILPVAFARGMTIGSWQPEIMIVDESENLTLKHMFLMLSRIGSHKNSKVILCGDSYQTDLGHKDDGSLGKVERILKGSKSVSFITFDKHDVVRSPEVQEIVERFENYEMQQKEKIK